jgi:hypothetical protein
MLEGVLKDLQGVIKKEKKDYSFEKSPLRVKNHYTSVRSFSQNSPHRLNSTYKSESRIPRTIGSLDARELSKKHKFNPSDERNKTPKSRPHSSRKSYEGHTSSSKIRTTLKNTKSQNLIAEDEEHESMELPPPVPHNHIRIRNEAGADQDFSDTNERVM